MKSNRSEIQSQFRPWQRLTSIFTLFFFLMQTSVGAIGSTLTNQAIETFFAYDPQFQMADSNDQYSYQAADYIQQGSTLNITTIDQFYQLLIKNSPLNVKAPTMVPIGIGDILTFIPVYEKYKSIGTPFVQIRFVRDQVADMLGRNLIDTESGDPRYATEFAQLATLYENAYTYALTEIDLKFGQPLELSRDDAPYNMVWPELRVINGEEVLVPVVYLTASTVGARKVTENTTTFGGEVNFQNIVIDGATVQLGRDAFLKTVQDLTVANGGSIVSADALNLNVGGSLALLSGHLEANGDVRIGASSISAETLVHRYDYGYEQGGTYGEIASISANGDVLVRSYSDIEFLGAIVDSSGGITFAADGNIYIGSQQIVTQGQFGGGWNGSYTNVDYLQSKLTAEEAIKLMANGSIVIDAAEIVSSRGHIEILAGLGITIDSDLQTYQSSKVGKFKKRTITESIYQTVAIRALLDAGKGVRLHSELGDIVMNAANIKSVEGARVQASNGSVSMLMTTETDHYSYSSVKEGMFTTRTVNQGHNIETGIPNTIIGGLQVEALGKVNVEYRGDSSLTLDQQIAKLSQMEGLEWMASVRSQSELDVDWNAIEFQYETWKETNTSLSPAFAAVVSIAIAIAMGPAGLGVGGVITGTGTMATAMSAGVVALATQASMAAINGAVNGDIGQAMEDFASDDTLKSLAVSMITAGAIAELDAAFFDVDSIAVESLKSMGPATPEMIQEVLDEATKSLTFQAVEAVTKATVNAGVSTIIQGGSFSDFGQSFGSALGNHLVGALGEDLAGEIGAEFRNGHLDEVARYLAHAALGCGLGSAKQFVTNNSGDDLASGCASGAGGAVIGELTAQIYSDLNAIEDVQELSNWRNTGANYAELLAAFAVAVAGGDPNIAAFTGKNAALYNWLSVVEVMQFGGMTLRCTFESQSGAPVCASAVFVLALEQSKVNDEDIGIGLLNGLIEQGEDILAIPENIGVFIDLVRSGDVARILTILKDGLVQIPVDVLEAMDAATKLIATADDSADYQFVGEKLATVLTYLASEGVGKVALNIVKKVDVNSGGPDVDFDSPNNDIDTGNTDLEFDDVNTRHNMSEGMERLQATIFSENRAELSGVNGTRVKKADCTTTQCAVDVDTYIVDTDEFDVPSLDNFQQKELVDKIRTMGDPTGELTEQLVDSMMVQFTRTKALPTKYESNNGLDHVYQLDNGTVIVVESKQFSNGAFEMQKANASTGRPVQMTKEYIDWQADQMLQTGKLDLAITADVILNATNVVRVVAGVDKATGKVIFVPLQ